MINYKIERILLGSRYRRQGLKKLVLTYDFYFNIRGKLSTMQYDIIYDF